PRTGVRPAPEGIQKGGQERLRANRSACMDTALYRIHECIVGPETSRKPGTSCEHGSRGGRMTDTRVAGGGATTRRRETTRRRLLDAAAQVFAEVGLDAASVEAVCDRAGFTRGAFYSNFETKDQLFLELAREVALDRVEAVRRRIGELDQDEAFAD